MVRDEMGMARPLAVTVIQPGHVLGGAERWQLQIRDGTRRVDWSLIALGEGEVRAPWEERGHAVDVVAAPPAPWALLRASAQVMSRLRRTRPDVVVAHGVKASLVALPAHMMAGAPLVWVRHDDSFARWAPLLGRLVTGQIATSPRLCASTTRTRHTVLPPPRTRPVAPMPAPAPDEQALVLGTAGRLVPYKGFDDAIRALATTVGAGSRWRLEVYGVDDPTYPNERDRLRRLARSLGVTDRVTIHPQVSDLGTVLDRFDAVAVLTRPSPSDGITGEGFGMVALEAMTCGVPVIATPPVDQWAGAGCVPVPARDPLALAHALRHLDGRATRVGIAAAGLRRAGSHPDVTTTASRFVDFTAGLVHRPGAGVAGGPPISIVSTVRNEREAVATLVADITEQMRAGDELVIVDAGSTDGTWETLLEAAAGDPRITPIRAPGAGISEGRNTGIAAARHEHLACTDAGCRPHPGWLAAFRSAMTVTTGDALWTGTYEVAAGGPAQVAHRSVGYPDLRALERPTSGATIHGRLFGRRVEAARPTGRSVAFTKAVWSAAGGFPTEYQTGEDVLFGQRAVRAGHPALVVRDARVLWFQRETLAATARMFYRYGLGSGQTRHWPLLGRDLGRAVAYPAGVLALASGPVGVGVAGLAAVVYLSVPVVRAARSGGPAAAALVPVAAAVRDLAKAAGAVAGLAGQRA